MTCMALYVKPESGINFGRIAERCLRDIEWSQKIAALTVRDDYEPTLSRGLAGLGPLDVHAMATWPARFWWKFLRRVIAAKLRIEETETVNERRSA